MKKRNAIEITEKEVLEVLKEKYDKIFTAEKKVADFILSNPKLAVDSNVAELAKYSRVSDATVVRMCHRIGYSGYYQFRISLARDLGKLESSEKGTVEEDNEIGKIFSVYAENMTEIGKQIEEEVFKECAAMLRKAETVHIIAAGNTCNLSRYMGFRLERLGIRSTYDGLPEYFLSHINLAGERDVVLAISKSGSSKSVLKGLKLAKDKKIKTISVTSTTESPASEFSDLVLVIGGKHEAFSISKSYSYLNEFAVVNALLSLISKEERAGKVDVDRPEVMLAESKM